MHESVRTIFESLIRTEMIPLSQRGNLSVMLLYIKEWNENCVLIVWIEHTYYFASTKIMSNLLHLETPC